GHLDVVQALRSHYPDIVPMILSVHDDPYLITQLIQQGAMGYLLKSSKSKEIFAAVQGAYSSGSYINEHTLQAIQGRLNGKLNRSQGPSALTRREEEVLTLICQQLTAEEIGERLFISPKTVDGHRNNLLQKTGSRNITGLVIYAVKHKLVSVV
ncbi:MAG: response regulator transcription factor, partial [Bacteroidota bacterium]